MCECVKDKICLKNSSTLAINNRSAGRQGNSESLREKAEAHKLHWKKLSFVKILQYFKT